METRGWPSDPIRIQFPLNERKIFLMIGKMKYLNKVGPRMRKLPLEFECPVKLGNVLDDLCGQH